MIVTILKRVAIVFAIVYIGILLLLIANETTLVYPGSKYPRGNWTPTSFQFDEITFQSTDGTHLVGWYLPAPAKLGSEPLEEDSVETILLCHGNAENVAQSSAYIGNMLRQTLGANVFVFDYRGFGKSEGTPSEPGVLADAEAALAWLRDKSGKSAEKIILVGHSIGGGPAVHLASTQGAKALVLQRTFNAITEPAQHQYPWLPIRYLMRNKFPSVDKIKNYDGPVLQSHGTADSLVPIEMGRDLFDAAPTNAKRFIAVDGMTHLDPLPETYWVTLQDFVRNQTAKLR